MRLLLCRNLLSIRQRDRYFVENSFAVTEFLAHDSTADTKNLLQDTSHERTQDDWAHTC
jgi:hypothetical protein